MKTIKASITKDQLLLAIGIMADDVRDAGIMVKPNEDSNLIPFEGYLEFMGTQMQARLADDWEIETELMIGKTE